MVDGANVAINTLLYDRERAKASLNTTWLLRFVFVIFLQI